MRPRGASQTQATFASRFLHWRQHHGREARESLLRLTRTPVSTTLTVLVIAIALALPAGLMHLLVNVQEMVSRWDGNPQISVYLSPDSDETAQQRQLLHIRQQPGVASAVLMTPEQALTEFEHLSGEKDTVTLLGYNPLPAIITITPSQDSPEALRQLQARLQKLPDTDSVEMDMAWLERLRAMLSFATRLFSVMFGGLSLAVLLVITNTTRLAIESRRDEIITIKLLGATNGFVRRPFLYMGLWTGVFGGLLAALLITLVMSWLNTPVSTLAMLYQSGFHLQPPSLLAWLALPTFAALLGLSGAWTAVGRHLRALEPH